MPSQYEQQSSSSLLEQIFAIPAEGGKVIVYAPLKGIAFIANRALLNLIVEQCRAANPQHIKDPALGFLRPLNFFSPEPHPIDEYATNGIAYDTVVLFGTNQCSLRCIYCYASSGDFEPRAMPWHMAKAAIDRVMGDVMSRGENQMTLAFHGGGEPTMNWSLLTKATDYTKKAAAKHDIELSIAGAFNGYWPPKVRAYMLENFTDISLSFDGLPEVQNAQRPALGGKDSFDVVQNTLNALDNAGVNYSIRMTVTRDHVQALAKSVEAICSQHRPLKIQAEPVFLEGRASKEQAVENVEAFVEQFISAHRIASEYCVDFFYSGARPEVLSQRFCMAACRALVVTTEGHVSTCFETYGEEHPLSANFIVGKYEEDGTYRVSEAKLAKHLSRTADNIPYCRGCFCRWHCAGDCSIKSSHAGQVDNFQPTERCHINRELTKYLILYKIHKSGGLVWQRGSETGE